LAKLFIEYNKQKRKRQELKGFNFKEKGLDFLNL